MVQTRHEQLGPDVARTEQASPSVKSNWARGSALQGAARSRRPGGCPQPTPRPVPNANGLIYAPVSGTQGDLMNAWYRALEGIAVPR